MNPNNLGSPLSETQEKEREKIHSLKCCASHRCKSYFVCAPCRQIYCKKSMEKHLENHPTKYPGVGTLDDRLEDIIELLGKDEEALITEIETERKKGEQISEEEHIRLEELEKEEAEIMSLVKTIYRKKMKTEASALYGIKCKQELIASKLEDLNEMRARIHQDDRNYLEKIVREHLGRAMEKRPESEILQSLVKEKPASDVEEEDTNLIIKQVKEMLDKK